MGDDKKFLGLAVDSSPMRKLGVGQDTETKFKPGTLLIVDDEVHILRALRRLLHQYPYQVLTARSGEEALAILAREPVDVVIIDYWMPVMDGLTFARMLKDYFPGVVRMMLTGCIEFDVVNAAVKRGEIYRYLVKPWEEKELIKTIDLAIELGRQAAAGAGLPGVGDVAPLYNLATGRDLQAPSPQALKPMPGWAEKMMELTRAVETRDPYTQGHSSRVAMLSLWLGKKLGLELADQHNLEIGALLHDIGKITIPDSILFKPAALSPRDLAAIQNHPRAGEDMLVKQDAPLPVRRMVGAHHEDFDGAGYPDRLAGDAIPLAARIIRLADTFDAMHHRRPYREGISIEKIKKEIETLAGRQFDPALVPFFLAVLEERKAELKEQNR